MIEEASFDYIYGHVHSQIQINETDYLGTMLALLDRDMLNSTAQLRQPHVTQWATTPTNVNAFHTFQSNAISGYMCIWTEEEECGLRIGRYIELY